MKIIYFTAEFPGQTHIFLWREYQELLRIGIDVHIVSTRAPPVGMNSFSWSAQARKDTDYLYPFSFSDCWGAVVAMLLCPSRRLKKIFGVIFRTGNLTIRDRMLLIVHLFLATKMVKLVAYENATHIHCTTCASTANIALFNHLLSGTPYSLSLLGPRLETYGANQANKWRYASFSLFQSIKLLRETRDSIPNSIPDLHAFAPVGVNTEIVCRDVPYQAWTPHSTVKLYCCGRLNPVKGHEYVIQAARRLIDRGYQVSLKIGGEDAEMGRGYRKVIESEIDRNQLQDCVTLLGAVSEEENILQYRDAHVYVMGSLDEAAGAVAAMEAMAMEVPVVMTDAGANSELIDNGIDGLLVEVKNADALANAIEHLLNNPEEAVRLGCNGRSKVREKFNHHLSARAIADFLTKTQKLKSVPNR